MMIPVRSSAIRAIGYDPFRQILSIQFTSGNTIYLYPGVPWTVYAGLMNAGSKGGFYHAYIHGRYLW